MKRIKAMKLTVNGKEIIGDIVAFLPTPAPNCHYVGVFAPDTPASNTESPRRLQLINITDLFIFN